MNMINILRVKAKDHSTTEQVRNATDKIEAFPVEEWGCEDFGTESVLDLVHGINQWYAWNIRDALVENLSQELLELVEFEILEVDLDGYYE